MEQEFRHSTRARTSTLAGKFGNAIPISNIEEQGTRSKNVICQVQIVPSPNQTKTTAATSREEPHEVISLSTSVECTEIQVESQIPEHIRATGKQKDNEPEDKNMQESHHEKPPTLCPQARQDRTISSRYVIDRPARATTPCAAFLKNFDTAMSILQAISPIKTQ